VAYGRAARVRTSHSDVATGSRRDGREKAKGAFVSESALHIDGGKPNSVPAPVFLASPNQLDCFSKKLGLDDDHLSSSSSFASDAAKIDIFARKTGAGRSELTSAVVRRYPRINPERFRGVRTGCPPSVLSCTAWGFSCLANYSASGELLPRLFNLACALAEEANSFPYIAKEPAVSFL
jgi:hypothetical protein